MLLPGGQHVPGTQGREASLTKWTRTGRLSAASSALGSDAPACPLTLTGGLERGPGSLGVGGLLPWAPGGQKRWNLSLSSHLVKETGTQSLKVKTGCLEMNSPSLPRFEFNGWKRTAHRRT